MSDDYPLNCSDLRTDYVSNAIHLGQSFARIAARAFQMGDQDAAVKAAQHAEQFYTDAHEMLSKIEQTDAVTFGHPLADLRRRLDKLERAGRSASA